MDNFLKKSWFFLFNQEKCSWKRFAYLLEKVACFLGVCTKTLRRGNSEGRSNSALVSAILL
ncbi:MAG: hypothetical protein ACTSV5_12130 [Promethearchaeota archaeon]